MTNTGMFLAAGCVVCVALLACRTGVAQTGSEHEPVRYVGGRSIDLAPHDGRLRPAIGVANYQTVRANRTHPERAEGHGWTYNHAPALAYWNGTFYLEYLSNPVDEHIAPGHTLVVTSPDGRDWGQPTVVFPAYEPPPGTPMPKGCDGYMMHQRMGFYAAPDGRLLVLAFYGHAEDPFKEGGIGRVVREAYKDGTFGPIHFIRYTTHADWNENNTSYPFYTRSPDKEFVAACDALLADRLMTLQWWDEDRGPEGFYPLEKAGEALCFYHRRDGNIVALWKWSLCGLSVDGGQSFSAPVKVPTITMDGAKIWGQRTGDGRYALVYNPTTHGEHRYPLAIVTGDDGMVFDDMLLIHGEVPPRRFFGRWKDFGPQYTRGIAEGNGAPPGDAFWVTYSVNKEDMWVSRIPTPVRYRVAGPVNDDFSTMDPGDHVPDWNVYSPRWSPVRVVEFPSAENKCLELRDEDPYDYAKAVRVFQEGTAVRVRCRVLAKQHDAGSLDIELLDQFGNRPVRICFDGEGRVRAANGATVEDLQGYEPNTWYDLDIAIDATPSDRYTLSVNGETVLSDAALAEAVRSVERISFRTGPYRDKPTRKTPNMRRHDPLPGADDPAPLSVYYVDYLQATSS